MAPSGVAPRLIEIEVHVRDLDAALRFYRDLVGLPVGEIETHENDGAPHAHVTWGDWDERGEFLMLNLYRADTAGRTRASVGFAVADLERVHARLLSAGVTVIKAPERRPWGVSATYLDQEAADAADGEGGRDTSLQKTGRELRLA